MIRDALGNTITENMSKVSHILQRLVGNATLQCHIPHNKLFKVCKLLNVCFNTGIGSVLSFFFNMIQ